MNPIISNNLAEEFVGAQPVSNFALKLNQPIVNLNITTGAFEMTPFGKPIVNPIYPVRPLVMKSNSGL